jgi:hypothetical protein
MYNRNRPIHSFFLRPFGLMSHPKDRLVVNLYIRTTDRRPLKPKKLSHFYTPDGRIDGWTDGRTDRQMDGRTDRQTNGEKDIQMDGRIDE